MKEVEEEEEVEEGKGEVVMTDGCLDPYNVSYISSTAYRECG